MKIALFAESYRPVINGAAVAVDLLAEALAERGHQISIFAPRFPGHADVPLPDRELHRFPSYTLPVQPVYPLAIPFAPEIARRFREGRFDVVHTQSPFTLGKLGRNWARRHGAALVTTYHTLYVDYAHYAKGVPQPLVRAYLRELSRGYSQSCDVVAVPTPPVEEVLRGYGVTRPIRVIPTGLRLRDPIPRDPRTRREFNIPADALVVLYAGRLAREKNLGLLFEGFARMAKDVGNAWLLIAGSGPEEATAQRMAAESGVGKRVVFAGFQPPNRMPELYAAADLFAFTSLTDTQGLVLTEAKAAGLPAVSVNAYGPGVVVRDGIDGILTPNDPAAFAQALKRVLTSGELRITMREGALREANRFSIQTTAEAFENAYKEAIQLVPQPRR